MSKKAVQGINYVRPPELKFNQKKETDNYTTYEIETFSHLGYLKNIMKNFIN